VKTFSYVNGPSNASAVINSNNIWSKDTLMPSLKCSIQHQEPGYSAPLGTDHTVYQIHEFDDLYS